VGLVHDVARIPNRWRAGDTVFLLRGAGADLVRFVWQNAASFSLAHDVSDGGLELALREAADWCGTEPVPDRGEQGPGVIVGAAEPPSWPDVAELGVVP
jgi:hypothetical protein